MVLWQLKVTIATLSMLLRKRYGLNSDRQAGGYHQLAGALDAHLGYSLLNNRLSNTRQISLTVATRVL